MAKQAQASLEQADEALRRMVRETYKWLLAPMQEARPGKGLSEVIWEHFALNPGAANWSQEIERVLKENELLISEWAPIHLARILKDWFWKEDEPDTSALNVWQQSCQQLYLPRLKDDITFQNTVAAGAESRDFFGLAQSKENDQYLGFSYGKRTTPIMDAFLLLIAPEKASSYLQAQEAAQQNDASITPLVHPNPEKSGSKSTHQYDINKNYNPEEYIHARRKTRFYASIHLDPVQAKRQFNDIAEEVLQQFINNPATQIQITIEIHAEFSSGFDDNLQRTVKENCNVLKFKTAEFDSE